MRKPKNLGIHCDRVNIMYLSVYRHVWDWLYYSSIDEGTKVWDVVLCRLVDTSDVSDEHVAGILCPAVGAYY